MKSCRAFNFAILALLCAFCTACEAGPNYPAYASPSMMGYNMYYDDYPPYDDFIYDRTFVEHEHHPFHGFRRGMHWNDGHQFVGMNHAGFVHGEGMHGGSAGGRDGHDDYGGGHGGGGVHR